MSGSREAIAAALFSTVSAAYAWGSTPSRRLKLWADVPATQRPALFMQEASPQSYVWTAQPNPKRTYGAKLFVYVDTHDQNAIGSQTLNAIMDAIDAALAPPPGFLKPLTLSKTHPPQTPTESHWLPYSQPSQRRHIQ